VTLHATDSSGAADAVITITFNASGNGGSSTLTSTQNPIPLSAALGASQSTQIGISTNSSTLITISVGVSELTCAGVNWLSANINGTNTISFGNSASITVNGNSSGLTSGLCQGNVIVTPSVGTTLNIPVNFTIGSGTGGNLTASPNPVTFSFS